MLPKLAYIRRSYQALPPIAQTGWRMIRWAVPPKRRWYFEGCRNVEGQLWYADRKLVYETIRAFRPMTVFEVGTWTGGGSTLFISQALHDNGAGRLYTVEVDPAQHAKAIDNYKRFLPHLLPYVSFHLGSSTDVFPQQLARLGRVDAVMLDGFGAEQSLSELKLFLPYLHDGSILIMHDWLDVKMEAVRPVIERDPEWRRLRLVEPPQSVGIAVYQKSSK